MSATKLTPQTMQELVFHVSSWHSIERFSVTMELSNAAHLVRFDFCVDGGDDVRLAYVSRDGRVIQPLVTARFDGFDAKDRLDHVRDVTIWLDQCDAIIRESLLFIRRRHAQMPCGAGTLSAVRDILNVLKSRRTDQQ